MTKITAKMGRAWEQKVSQGYKRPALNAAAGWCQAVIVRLCYSFIIKVSDRDETSVLPTLATCPDIDRRTGNKLHKDTEKAPTRAFSWLKMPNRASTLEVYK